MPPRKTQEVLLYRKYMYDILISKPSHQNLRAMLQACDKDIPIDSEVFVELWIMFCEEGMFHLFWNQMLQYTDVELLPDALLLIEKFNSNAVYDYTGLKRKF